MGANEVSTSKYAKMVDKVREIYSSTGSKLFHTADDYGINDFYPSESGEINFCFYWDSLSKIYTPEGYITPLGSRMGGKDKDAMKQIIESNLKTSIK